MTPEEMDAHAEAWEEVARNAMGEAHVWRERAAEVRKRKAMEIAAEEEKQRKADLKAGRRVLGPGLMESVA